MRSPASATESSLTAAPRTRISSQPAVSFPEMKVFRVNKLVLARRYLETSGGQFRSRSQTSERSCSDFMLFAASNPRSMELHRRRGVPLSVAVYRLICKYQAAIRFQWTIGCARIPGFETYKSEPDTWRLVTRHDNVGFVAKDVLCKRAGCFFFNGHGLTDYHSRTWHPTCFLNFILLLGEGRAGLEIKQPCVT
jgi:hypothetical protein